MICLEKTVWKWGSVSNSNAGKAATSPLGFTNFPKKNHASVAHDVERDSCTGVPDSNIGYLRS